MDVRDLIGAVILFAIVAPAALGIVRAVRRQRAAKRRR